MKDHEAAIMVLAEVIMAEIELSEATVGDAIAALLASLEICISRAIPRFEAKVTIELLEANPSRKPRRAHDRH
jgi:hypothetical protein